MKPIEETQKTELPLKVEFQEGEFRLEPLTRYNDIQEFRVTFKFYRTIGISELARGAVKDIGGFVKNNCLMLLREANDKCKTQKKHTLN